MPEVQRHSAKLEHLLHGAWASAPWRLDAVLATRSLSTDPLNADAADFLKINSRDN